MVSLVTTRAKRAIAVALNANIFVTFTGSVTDPITKKTEIKGVPSIKILEIESSIFDFTMP